MTTPRSKNALRIIARWTGSPVWSRIRPRVETIAADRSAQVARELRAELADLRAELQSNVTDLRSAVAATHERINQVEWTQERLGPQVAAVDERLAAIERPVPAAGDPSERAEARSLVEEIRSEHARVRTRLSAVASYEHRIAKLEQTLTTLTGNAN
jgi:predicted  nucleic acid-binding Zn-ribbon protein